MARRWTSLCRFGAGYALVLRAGTGLYADDKSTAGRGVAGRSWVENNPPEQKFTKTDLAKFEQIWRGLPHLVCLGAEKNFMRFAEQMEDEGVPLVDLT